MLEAGHTRFLIEKIVCQSSTEYRRLISKFKKFKSKGWVNTNYRYFEFYQNLKNYFSGSKLIHFSITSSNLSALGTKSIHYLDLFSFFNNDYHLKLNGDFMIKKLFPNIRGPGFVEFAGTVIGYLKNGSSITMTFIPSMKLPSIVNIIGHDKHILIDETHEKAIDMINSKTNFKFRYEHPSSLTTKIIKEILDRDSCKLTTLENSYLIHSEMFRIFNAHIKKLTKKKLKFCPIT